MAVSSQVWPNLPKGTKKVELVSVCVRKANKESEHNQYHHCKLSVLSVNGQHSVCVGGYSQQSVVLS